MEWNPRAIDGTAILREVLERAGFKTTMHAVAQYAVFLHPRTVDQTHGAALFPTIRDAARRGEFGTARNGRQVLFDDNSSPTAAFK